jgi:Sigma-70 region 2
MDELDLCPRSDRRALTPSLLSDVWPDVEPGLRRYAKSRGLVSSDVEDVLQEVALRVLSAAVAFSDAEDLRRYCFRVARNLMVDLTRLRDKPTDVQAWPAGHSALDAVVALERVLDRHLLATIARRLMELTPKQRQALGPPSSEATPAERNRCDVARHRARKRLLELVGPLSMPLPGLAVLRRKGLWLGKPVMLAVPTAMLGGLLVVPPPTATDSAEYAQDAAVSDLEEIDRSASRVGATSRVASPATLEVRPRQQHRGSLRAGSPIAGVRGPARLHGDLSLEENDGRRPLLCLDGDLIKHCVDIRPETDPRADAAAELVKEDTGSLSESLR